METDLFTRTELEAKCVRNRIYFILGWGGGMEMGGEGNIGRDGGGRNVMLTVRKQSSYASIHNDGNLRKKE